MYVMVEFEETHDRGAQEATTSATVSEGAGAGEQEQWREGEQELKYGECRGGDQGQ
jgi:hypothetical protein